MLWGGHNGIVSFEGSLTSDLLPRKPRPGSDKDLTFLRSFEVPERIAYGLADTPVFRFLCIPDTAYTDRLPSGRQVVRDLAFEAKVRCEAGGFDRCHIWYVQGLGHTQLHTDRYEQLIFRDGNEVREGKEGEAEDESAASHQRLEEYVKHGRLFYATFCTKKHLRNGPAMSDHIYVFAVGVSPHSGNLVGVFSMQVERHLKRKKKVVASSAT